MVGFTPGLTPFSHDSVAHIISGLRKGRAVPNSARLFLILRQLTVMMRMFFFTGVS